MNWNLVLKDKFKEKVISAKINHDKELNVEVLEVVVNSHDIKEIENITKQINEFIDANFENKINFDNLSILSPGVKYDFVFEDLCQEMYGEKLKIKLKKNQYKNNEFIGKLLEKNNDFLILLWNNKGQMRKIQLEKENIQKIEKYLNI
ncbi:ribosome assembly cofactor RimP [Mycoplasmopsis lipofaciens]|uniref:ribosome assembly cofactor RimP n=1 Tax=Mycoplasmopsis lipofaciens TaxID=114884 RepID=UPI0004897049|nr:ribosome assembly cofactor RimP [Mycoplasmopsis lipofaciens]